MELSKKNRLAPDSLKWKREDYLKSLIKLTGDFEEINTINRKFQNQPADIDLSPLFNIFPGRVDYEKTRLYDAYQKPHYYSNIIVLTNIPEMITDSLCKMEIELQGRLLESNPDNPEYYLKRALSFAALNNFNLAFNDYNSSLKLDSNFILAYFCRANSRYELIQILQSPEINPVQVTVGMKDARTQEHTITSGLEHTYETVINDYDKALLLDPGFYFAYYNRGFVNCRMGNYQQAVADFSKAIQYKADFAEAYYGRGLIYIFQDEKSKGCLDLSRAGELGILDAYRILKRFCKE
jgi:tetratricopeptide (TPR) repeat protein